VSNRVGGAGQRDIWKCTKTLEGKWGKAENLGRTINTTMDEESIYIHPDGKTLYFSSKGHHSTGGYDVYRSTLVKGKWTKPINLGKPINTEADDLFFVLDASGKRGYYTSSASGNKDIYQIDFTPLKEEKIKQPLVTILKGIVIDEVSKKPLESTIEIVDNNTHELISKLNSNSASGKFLISLPSGHNYGINVSADGYLFHSENFELSDSSAYAEVSKQILMKKMEVGTTIVLRNIFFDVAKTTLRPSSVTELNRLIDIMVKNPNIQIEISGHTDNQGSDVYNQNLSEGRAKAVVDFLIEHKVDAARLTFKGYGESKPIDTNDTDAGKQNNRRTEFKILKI
jgi:outer membrane protein OmpA-like peptidoglycan-associated protein